MSVFHYIESKAEGENAKIVGHSSDEKTGEVYYKFVDKPKAKKLLSDEKKVRPNLKYRIVTVRTNFSVSQWE